ncbi:MAG: regulatory protein GemA [Alphaproteobacteria bacterium]|nr:regulatory protein GemA [Alphaproteobacteria bacterium]
MSARATAARRPAAPAKRVRLGLYSKIAIGCKDLSIDEEARRDLMAARYGKRSMTALSVGELEDLLAYLKAQGFRPTRSARGPKRAGGRPLADAPEAKKARALWLSLYHLAVVRNPQEGALAAFGQRQTGKAALQWIRGDWRKVIEALKDMAAREAGVDWRPYKIGFTTLEKPRCRVIEAQWRILGKLGVVVADSHALSAYVSRFAGRPAGISVLNLSDAEADRLIEQFGQRIRKAQAEGPGS